MIYVDEICKITWIILLHKILHCIRNLKKCKDVLILSKLDCFCRRSVEVKLGVSIGMFWSSKNIILVSSKSLMFLNVKVYINAYLWPILSKWDSSVHMVKIQFLVCYWSIHSSIYNMVKILKSNSLKQNYAHLIFGVLKSMKLRNRLSKVGVCHCVNCQLSRKS